MKVLGELCQCRLCKSSGSKGPAGRWWPCGCIIGQERDDHYTHEVEGVEVEGQVYPIDRVKDTGGRRAVWIYLEDGEFVEWLPARRVGEEITDWYGHPVEVLARFPASVHGCWKVVARQELVVLRKKEK
jgi:hypothetical protein